LHVALHFNSCFYFNPRPREGSDDVVRVRCQDLKGFQSTPPRRERLHGHRWRHREVDPISIHAPAKGATDNRRIRQSPPPYFNPRPREGSDAPTAMVRAESSMISIHAPAKGATTCWLLAPGVHTNFNPRPREGSDPDGFPLRDIIGGFQSTPPRRERHFTPAASVMRAPISIHAPAKGATHLIALGAARHRGFQSTPPRRERLSGILTDFALMDISIHAPAKGATLSFATS